MKTRIPPGLITLALICFLLVQNMKAVLPPPDGGYPGSNTAEGQNALLSLTTGLNNSAVGWLSLKSNTDGQMNTAVGSGTLYSTVHGNRNTAVGGAALFSNAFGSSNTAVGALALWSNTDGGVNSAIGDTALFSNTTGNQNTATGYGALRSNTTGDVNTATGVLALANNTIGALNTAVGFFALNLNNSGSGNTAIGYTALEGSQGSGNTAVGAYALVGGGDGNTAVGGFALSGNLSGSLNTALGEEAGSALEGGDSNNIDIGANVEGVTGESNTIRIGDTNITDTFIGGISETTVANGAAVLVDSNGHLGTVTSSRRFKEEIRPMNKTSEAIFSLEPVTFRYRKEIDPAGTSQFGLIAEEVAKVNPNLVVLGKDGKPYTVRYEAVNAMLLNEFLKEHRKNDEQQVTIAQLKSAMEALTATVKEQAEQIQKVSAQLEASRSAPQVATSNY
jgi:hypothetical protein